LEPFDLRNMPALVDRVKDLWTDSDCNVKWYVSHGYELVDKGVYEPFSNDDEEYKTFIFKRKI